MDCTPDSLIAAATCYRCIPPPIQRSAMISLLCQWARASEGCVIHWEPENQQVSWHEGALVQTGDYATFIATANINAVELMDFQAAGGVITSLTCPQGLPALFELIVSDTNLTTLDVSACHGLITLRADNTLLSTLDVSGLTNLSVLECFGNPNLTSINIAGCTSLSSIDASGCDITGTFDATPCAGSLVTLNLEFNANLDTLIVTGCTSLETLIANHTALTTLTGLLTCSSLIHLSLVAMPMAGTLEMHDLANLTDCDVSTSPNITTVNAYNCVAMQSIAVDNCPALVAIDVHGDIALVGLDLTTGNGNVQSLDASNCPAIVNLDCFGNVITALNIANCSALTGFNAQNNLLSTASVDALYSQIVAAALANAGGIDLTGTNQPPTGGCLNADIVNLKANGWTVTGCP